MCTTHQHGQSPQKGDTKKATLNITMLPHVPERSVAGRFLTRSRQEERQHYGQAVTATSPTTTLTTQPSMTTASTTVPTSSTFAFSPSRSCRTSWDQHPRRKRLFPQEPEHESDTEFDSRRSRRRPRRRRHDRLPQPRSPRHFPPLARRPPPAPVSAS